jgi:CRISP-associated protein Cas1
MSTPVPAKQSFYIFSGGTLQRRENTVRFVPAAEQQDRTVEIDPSDFIGENVEESFSLGPAETEKQDTANARPLPVTNIDAFYVFGEVTFNTRFLNFLTRHRIPMHLFNYYGYYSGTYYPRDYLISGYLVVNQVRQYSSAKKRLDLARAFISAAATNILKNLRYYAAESRGGSFRPEDTEKLNGLIAQIEALSETLIEAGDIPTLMGLEGNIRQRYYDAWPLLIRTDDPAFQFELRIKNPPNNAVNALISFGNSLMYSACLTEIYRTQLHPAISFLHEPSERRFSLALDIAEIFKPIFVDRVIFKLVNTRALQQKHFSTAMNFCHLNDAGRKIFVKEFEEKLRTTIKHRTLDRHVSYRRLVRLECYKLIKHLLGEKEYEGFKIWW